MSEHQEASLVLSAERTAPAARPGMTQIELHPDWLVLSSVPMRLTAFVPVPRFTVQSLLALREGHIVSSHSNCMDDVPVRLGGVQLGWSEFEVVEQRIAVRLTRLA